jgi:hypothetical protein
VDRLFQRSGIGAVPGRQYHKKALLGKLLGDGTADAPTDADGQVTIIEHLPKRQFGIAAIGLPLRCRSNHNSDRLTGCVHSRFPPA